MSDLEPVSVTYGLYESTRCVNARDLHSGPIEVIEQLSTATAYLKQSLPHLGKMDTRDQEQRSQPTHPVLHDVWAVPLL